MRCQPTLYMDYYKACHDLMLPKDITKSVSYFMPRSSRINAQEAVFFGLQGFIREYLIEEFNENFFKRSRGDVLNEYQMILDATFGSENYSVEKIGKLYDLGYLPIEIRALPEGMRVPMKVPMFSITNTHPDFAWLPQMLESLISCEMWHGIVSATIADKYKKIVRKYCEITCDDADPSKMISCFDMRGEESLSGAVKAGAAWATSFKLCATVPTAMYLAKYYDTYPGNSIAGSPSTEHAVMCSNTAVDGNEVDLLKRLLTEVYPNTSFSAVLDSYDYKRMVREVLPQLKSFIMTHKGCFLVRGDSGDPVEVAVSTVVDLWAIFGGTKNSKGYKVLDPHVKAIYGDGITLERCEKIYEALRMLGFAASNVALGAGSFSFQAIEEDGKLKPFTRDTFNIAIKATYIELKDGESYKIFKSPKVAGAHGEDEEYFKKSPKGCMKVSKDLKVTADLTYDEVDCEDNIMIPVFRDGKMLVCEDMNVIRRRLE